MTWTIVTLAIVVVALCAFGWAVLRGLYLNAQLDELLEERKSAREEARRIAREREKDELRHAAE